MTMTPVPGAEDATSGVPAEWRATVRCPADIVSSYAIIPVTRAEWQEIDPPLAAGEIWDGRCDARRRWQALSELIVEDPEAELPAVERRSSGRVRGKNAPLEPGWEADNSAGVGETPRPGWPDPWAWDGEGKDSSGGVGSARDVWVVRSHRPAPVVLVLFDGLRWVTTSSLPAVLDALSDPGGKYRIPPVDLVAIDAKTSTERYTDLTRSAEFREAVLGNLLPTLSLGSSVGQRVILAGQSLGGLASVDWLMARPDAVHGAISGSGSFWYPNRWGGGPVGGNVAEDLRREPQIATTLAKAGHRVYVDAGFNEGGGSDGMVAHSQAVAAELREGGVEVFEDYSTHGHDYAAWRGSLTRGLCAVLGDGWGTRPLPTDI